MWLISDPPKPSWSPTEVILTQSTNIVADEFNSNKPTRNTTTEEGPGIHHVIGVSEVSSLNKLIRVTAYVLRFIGHVKKQ